MEIPKFDAWCSRAVKGIRYPGDRRRVFRELREHMEDHYDDAMGRGLVHWKAVNETLEAMATQSRDTGIICTVRFYGATGELIAEESR